MFEKDKVVDRSHRSHQKSQFCLNCFEDIEKDLSIFETLFRTDRLCVKCRHRLEKNKRSFTIDGKKLNALYLYNNQASQWMMQIKEAHDITLAPVFIQPYLKKLRKEFKGKTLIIVPSSYEKTQERGYHALKEMVRELQIDCRDVFIKDTLKQSKKNRQERLEISKHIYLKESLSEMGPIVLLDDVCTTGESLRACIHLLEPYSSSIECFVLCIHPYWLKSEKII